MNNADYLLRLKYIFDRVSMAVGMKTGSFLNTADCILILPLIKVYFDNQHTLEARLDQAIMLEHRAAITLADAKVVKACIEKASTSA